MIRESAGRSVQAIQAVLLTCHPLENCKTNPHEDCLCSAESMELHIEVCFSSHFDLDSGLRAGQSIVTMTCRDYEFMWRV